MFPEHRIRNNGPELQERRVRRIFIETPVGWEKKAPPSPLKEAVQRSVSGGRERKGKTSRSQKKSVPAWLWTEDGDQWDS